MPSATAATVTVVVADVDFSASGPFANDLALPVRALAPDFFPSEALGVVADVVVPAFELDQPR